MKKKVLVLMALVVGGFSSVALADKFVQHNENESQVVLESQGRGRCTHPNCKCQKFDQRPGYYQCWCGHQSSVHK